VFGIVCKSIFSDFSRSWSIEMVQLAPGSAWHGDQDAMCDIMFVVVYLSIFSNFTRSCSIEMVQLAPGSA
jgi:hypothetical protein